MFVENEELSALEERLRTILPKTYQDSYEEVQPVSMGSAPLKYDGYGRVAWDEIWGSFCDLAMAGGPPHKGALLTPATRRDIDEQPDLYKAAVNEICRGIFLVTDIEASESAVPGWIQVPCEDEVMAGWLLRAITMENVATYSKHATLFLPAGPNYRVEKEVKNVITVIAKTCHYWVDHMWSSQQRQIANLFTTMAVHQPLIGPPLPFEDSSITGAHAKVLGESIFARTRLAVVSHSNGWLGLQCHEAKSAIWMMRGLVACNILSRREGSTLFIPTNEKADPDGRRTLKTLSQVLDLYKISASKETA